MRFEQSDQEGPKILITFEGDEVSVVRAAYREWMYRLAEHGNIGSISEHETDVADWSEDSTAQAIRVFDYASVEERLDAFHDKTDDAIQEITEVTGVPAYASPYISERYKLGKRAAELSGIIHEQAELGTTTHRMEAELAQIIDEQEKR